MERTLAADVRKTETGPGWYYNLAPRRGGETITTSEVFTRRYSARRSARRNPAVGIIRVRNRKGRVIRLEKLDE